MNDPSALGPDVMPEASLSPPEMPSVDVSKLSRYPDLIVDSDGLRHTLGWQRSAGFDGRACFAVCKLSNMTGIKVVERFPLTQAGWADAWADLLRRDPASARMLLDILARREAGLGDAALLAPPPPPRFPSSAATRSNILNEIAKGNEKYARPFDRGKVALASFIGTESWSDYGNVVLQMAILDTLLSIERKLDQLLGPDDDSGAA